MMVETLFTVGIRFFRLQPVQLTKERSDVLDDLFNSWPAVDVCDAN